MSTNSKSVIDAAKAVVEALDGLTTEEQQKVIDGVAVLLGLTPAKRSDGGKIAGDDAEGGDSRAREPRGAPKQQSLVEYLTERKPATNPQRIAVFAAYREEVEGLENFAKDDLKAYFPKAKLSDPGRNYGREYDKAVSEGWIHDDGTKSYLTQTGSAAVLAGFDGKAKPRGKAVARTSRKKRKTE